MEFEEVGRRLGSCRAFLFPENRYTDSTEYAKQSLS